MRLLILMGALVALCSAKSVTKRAVASAEVDQMCVSLLDKAETDWGFFPDINDCHNYYMCFRQTVFGKVIYHNLQNTCPQGNVWLAEFSVCAFDQNGNGCAEDPCDYVDTPFADPDNCGSYYVCDNGNPVKMCCPQGLGYNAVTMDCDQTCSQICNSIVEYNDTDVNVTNSECKNGNFIYNYFAEEGGVSVYQMTTLDRSKTDFNKCPVRTPVFSLEDCGCIESENPGDLDPPQSESCNTYNYEESFGKIQDNTVQWVDAFDAKLENGQLCFNGNGKLEVPFYAANDFRTYLRLAVSFTVTAENMNSGKLITNGDNATPYTVNVELINGELGVTLVTDNGRCEVKTNFEEGTNTANILYNGAELIMDISSGPIAQSIITSTACTGDVLPTPDPIRFGDGGFTGCLDDISICKQ